MKIIRHLLSNTSLNDFAEQHNLTMAIRQRHNGHGPLSGLPKFFASFYNCDISEPGVLVGVYGNGNTENEAINDYAKKIAGKLLVVNAYIVQREEIRVPDNIENY